MLMDIIAYAFGVIAVAAGVLCFIDENFGEKFEDAAKDGGKADK